MIIISCQRVQISMIAFYWVQMSTLSMSINDYYIMLVSLN